MRAILNAEEGETLKYPPVHLHAVLHIHHSKNRAKECRRINTFLGNNTTAGKFVLEKERERENPICDLNFRLIPLGTENSTKLRRKNEYFVGVRQAVSEGTAGSFGEHFSSGGSRESFVSRTAAVASPPCRTPLSFHPFRNLHHEGKFVLIQCKTMRRVVQSAENGF
ncbi:hypothetical protein TNCV_1359401 [Trichonephila clavipes]|nr:hypothetical protein TNCV_1359401 [Trichonephila clavipes]